MADRIIVVDDEREIADLIGLYLENDGYEVHKFLNGADALSFVEKCEPALAVLDVMLPDTDGFALLRKMREKHDFPIIMLTARSEDADLLMGFESGADDYVTKPFNILALKARIRALLRRASIAAAPAAAEEKSGTISRGHITVDEAKRCAMKSGEEVELTMKEFDLILFLMKNPGKVYSREALLDLVWGYDYQGDTRTVDVHIRRLREKLELNPAQPEYIITKWGVGYYFAD